MVGAHENSVWDLAWHPVGHILASGSNDHTTKFWCRQRPGDPMDNKRQKTNMANVLTDEDGKLIDDEMMLEAIPEKIEKEKEKEKEKDKDKEKEELFQDLWGIPLYKKFLV